jgi:hypothetical protein
VQQARAAETITPPEPSVSEVQDQEKISGQLTMDGITAYFVVQRGDPIVFELVEDTTGKIHQVSPDQMLRVSGAIDQILSRKAEQDPNEGTEKS